MSKEVDSGIKKFFIVFLGFVVVLNVLSVLLFSHSLFYYFYNNIEISNWLNGEASAAYDNILNYSMIGKCFVPIILICFFLFLSFTIKHVKKYRRYIYTQLCI